ncbi:hypothetical protein ACTAQI_07815 [Pseudarthrobacter sp. alpha12b]
MEWFFDGFGTMVIGLVLGGAGGAAGGWTMAKNRFQRQSQKAGNDSSQIQVGRDYKKK